jgi:uncharacterized protein (DUF885 family)
MHTPAIHPTTARIAAMLLLLPAVALAQPAAQPAAQALAPEPAPVSVPAGSVTSGAYAELVALYDDFLTWREAGRPREGVFPDYGPATIASRRRTLDALDARLDAMASAARTWPLAQQVDYLAVRSRVDQQAFLLAVSRPFSRDPGFYVDPMLWLTFTALPVEGDDLTRLQRRLDAIPSLVAQARRNLTEVAADYADLAIFNLTHADGVGHGHPYRATPPAGVLGWYDDLLARARTEQPELVAPVSRARDAVAALLAWLRENRSSMTGQAGVGRDAFDWYLKHVKLMPWTAQEIVVLGQRELDRLWAIYALERHRNRNLPELRLPASAADYAERLEQTDRHIREFLVDEDIITIPDYVGELDTNAPWIVRPDGPNFWEQVQFRDPTPDHLHAVIPGHRFDGLLARHNDHPIRGRLTSGARAEGWAVYLEEAMLQAGLLADLPRVRELIQIFGIFRAARVPADVWLQLNDMTVDEVVTWWRERVPYLDANVARVDAEIYLRRPPGYGLGYTIGMLQMQRLLADRKRQLGDDFELKAFHDEFMAIGRLPISLIRWEMTGLDDEARHFWQREPMPSASR